MDPFNHKIEEFRVVKKSYREIYGIIIQSAGAIELSRQLHTAAITKSIKARVHAMFWPKVRSIWVILMDCLIWPFWPWFVTGTRRKYFSQIFDRLLNDERRKFQCSKWFLTFKNHTLVFTCIAPRKSIIIWNFKYFLMIPKKKFLEFSFALIICYEMRPGIFLVALLNKKWL